MGAEPVVFFFFFFFWKNDKCGILPVRRLSLRYVCNNSLHLRLNRRDSSKGRGNGR